MTLVTSRLSVVLKLLVFGLLLAACVKKFPTQAEQELMVRNGQLVVHQITSRAVLDVWGPPTYERREHMQFFTLENGGYVPFFRVPLGESPTGWDNGVIPGEALFLGYADRGELLGFLNDRLVYRESLSTESVHSIGKKWEKEDRFKTQLEKSLTPRR